MSEDLSNHYRSTDLSNPYTSKDLTNPYSFSDLGRPNPILTTDLSGNRRPPGQANSASFLTGLPQSSTNSQDGGSQSGGGILAVIVGIGIFVAVMTAGQDHVSASRTTSSHSQAYRDGYDDRDKWEKYVAGLGGDSRAGALFWAEVRNDSPRRSCNEGSAAPSTAYRQGCLAAVQYLTQADRRRLSDGEYRKGWNDY
jgi:hypothetical protein